MIKKNKEKVIYLIAHAGKKAPLIKLYALPTKCPVCHSFQEPELLAVQYNDNDDAMIQFRCRYNKCKTSFSAFYIKGSFEKQQYYFLCFI